MGAKAPPLPTPMAMQQVTYNQDPNINLNNFLKNFFMCINKHLPMKNTSRKQNRQSSGSQPFLN